LPCPLRVGVRFWASLTLRKLANASGRIVFNIALFMDWQFISGCLPPRLSTTQFPSTTDSQCSVRWGLPPHGWCALSGARRDALPRDPAWHAHRREQTPYPLYRRERPWEKPKTSFETCHAGGDFCGLGSEMRISLDQNRVDKPAHRFGLVVN